MTRFWRRLVAVLEIVGGVFGIAGLAWELLVSTVEGYAFLLAPIAYGIYILSLGAGVWLWREHRLGRKASVIVQAIQLPKVVSPFLIFAFSFGFDFYPYVQSDGVSSKVGADVRLLAFQQLYVNIQEAPFGVGISIPAVVFLIMLVLHKPASTRAGMQPPPPPTDSEWNRAADAASEQQPAHEREAAHLSLRTVPDQSPYPSANPDEISGSGRQDP